jgi:hypothetical protein
MDHHEYKRLEWKYGEKSDRDRDQDETEAG